MRERTERIATSLSAAVVLVAALGGCTATKSDSPASSTPVQTQPETRRPVTSSPATTTATPAAATIPASSPVPTGKVMRAPATLYSDCAADSDGSGALTFKR